MKVDYRDGEFIVFCSFEERLLPKAAGFQFDPTVKRWKTRSTGVAVSLGLDPLTAAAKDALGLNNGLPAPEGLSYLPFQSEGIEFGRAHSRTLIADQPGLGKGHPLSTPILTPTGFQPLGDLNFESKVIGWFGEPISITGIFDRGILPVYRVTFSDGASIKVDGEHLWSVSPSPHDELETLDTVTLAGRVERGERLCIPTLTEPAQIEPKLLLVPPRVAGVDQASMLGRDFENNPVFTDTMDYRVRDYGVVSPWQAQEFLHGVIGRIGRIREGAIRVDLVSNPQSRDLAQTIRECVGVLGGITHVERRFRHTRLMIYLPKTSAAPVMGYSTFGPKIARRWRDFESGIPGRWIERIESCGREAVRCISVDGPGNLYVAEHFIVTHNTIQALGIANALPEIDGGLIIVPASLKKNWLKEAKKWLIGNPSIDIADGGNFPDSDWVIINYEILNRHRAKLRSRVWKAVIPDEHHYCKNPDSGRTKELHGGVLKTKDGPRTLKERIEPIPAHRLIMLSGTPLASRTSDLFTTCRAADPNGLGRDREAFSRRYCGGYFDMDGTFKWDGEPDPMMLDELNAKMKARFMIRRLKADVLKDLPPKIRQIVPLPADGLKKKMAEERKAMTDLLDMYEKMVGIRKEMSDDDLVKAIFAISPKTWEKYAETVEGGMLTAQMPLSRLANARQDLAISKIPMVVEYVKNILESGEKVCIFGYHTAVIEGLMEAPLPR